MLEVTADPFSFPPPDVIAACAFFPSVSNGAPQACQGGPGYTTWYGKGQVTARSAIG
jgi:hypothetical protein